MVVIGENVKMKNLDVMFSSKTDSWSTPQWFYDKLNNHFKFTLDPCADETNHKCEKYFTIKDNGLEQDWGGNIVFCNPPYGREIKKWVEKCSTESKKKDTTCVMLIPSRTDTKWFHDYIYKKDGVDIYFVKGRLKFGNSTTGAPFPNMVVVFNAEH